MSHYLDTNVSLQQIQTKTLTSLVHLSLFCVMLHVNINFQEVIVAMETVNIFRYSGYEKNKKTKCVCVQVEVDVMKSKTKPTVCEFKINQKKKKIIEQGRRTVT